MAVSTQEVIVVNPAATSVVVVSGTAVGPQGATGVTFSDTPPGDHSILWADTSTTNAQVAVFDGGTPANQLTSVKIRRGLATTWSGVNPILDAGEFGYESDSTQFKFGDGVRRWNSLPYATTLVAGVAASSVTGTTLATNVVNSSITSFGTSPTIVSPTITGTATAATINATKLTVTATATASTDVTNKAYVDATAQGLNVHPYVRVASTAPITGTYTDGTTDQSQGLGIGATFVFTTAQIDGQTLAYPDRVLLKDQTDAKQNGIYFVSTTPSATITLTRATDANNSVAGQVAAGDYVFADLGTTNANSSWVIDAAGTATTPPKGIRIGTDNITISQFGNAGTYTAGVGITKSGSTFLIQSSGNTLNPTANNLDLTAVSQTNSTGNTSSNIVQGVTVDTYGRVTGVTSGTHTLASTTTAGIASFNNSNFSVVSGAANTIQDINTSASPTFNGLTVTTTATAATVVATTMNSTTFNAGSGAGTSGNLRLYSGVTGNGGTLIQSVLATSGATNTLNLPTANGTLLLNDLSNISVGINGGGA
jgi:hypothetical protein